MAQRTRTQHAPCDYCEAESHPALSDDDERICAGCAEQITIAFADLWPDSSADLNAGAAQ